MPATHRIDAPLIEIFSSLQGEGVLIGTRQVFIRFGGCNLSCDYCDTAYHPSKYYRIEEEPGRGIFSQKPNPASLEDFFSHLQTWHAESPTVHHSLVLTGGEPLMHSSTLKYWLPELRHLWPVFLETNGTMPAELENILPLVSFISMDIKGASVTGVDTPWATHANFMDVAKECLCQVKLVVDDSTPKNEVMQAADLVSKHAPEVPLVIQPRTTSSGPIPGGKTLLELQSLALSIHRNVRIIPQIHPWLVVA